MKKIEAGSFEYYGVMRKRQIYKTIGLFFVSLALFFAGYIATKTKANLLTVAAVLGLLPACKSMVEMIMYLKYNGCNQKLRDALFTETEKDSLTHSYGMVFTTPDNGTFEVPSVAVKNNCICGLCLTKKKKPDLLEKHITRILKQNGYSNVVVKMFDSVNAYMTRLKQMNETAADNLGRDGELMHLLHNISL